MIVRSASPFYLSSVAVLARRLERLHLEHHEALAERLFALDVNLVRERVLRHFLAQIVQFQKGENMEKELYYIRRRHLEGETESVSFYLMTDALGNPVWTPLESRAHLFEKPIAQAYEFFLSKMTRNGIIDTVRLLDRRGRLERPKKVTGFGLVGFGLIELLVALAIFGVLASLAVPNSVELVRYELRHQALVQVRMVRNAEAQLAICAAQNLPCPGVAAQIPTQGSVTTGGYVYVFAANGPMWSYTAAPIAEPNSSYYTDESGSIHVDDNGGTATNASPLIQ